MKINKVIIIINPAKEHLYATLSRPAEQTADLILAVGGDGTVLQAAHRFRGTGIPILGINIGYLGFITSIRGDRVRQHLRRIFKNDFVISQRAALDLEIQNGGRKHTVWALNDALITRGGNPHLIGITAYVGRRRLTGYRCDGLIIATPTGSTAYSLAAGGPIISPECNVVTVTPICPQALTNRSVVIAANEPVQMRLDPTSGPAEVQVDGMRLTRLRPRGTISASISRDSVPVAFLPEINYYDVLTEKLKWRGDGLTDR
jgi:NAD+ kinase